LYTIKILGIYRLVYTLLGIPKRYPYLWYTKRSFGAVGIFDPITRLFKELWPFKFKLAKKSAGVSLMVESLLESRKMIWRSMMTKLSLVRGSRWINY